MKLPVQEWTNIMVCSALIGVTVKLNPKSDVFAIIHVGGLMIMVLVNWYESARNK